MCPAAMGPESVASSSMHTALDTPLLPLRQNQGLQPEALQPQPPLAIVTRKDLAIQARIAATKTPLTRASLDIPASLDQPAILNYPAIQKKKTLAGQGIPAIRKTAAVLALPGTPINPPMDAENKDTTPRATRQLQKVRQRKRKSQDCRSLPDCRNTLACQSLLFWIAG